MPNIDHHRMKDKIIHLDVLRCFLLSLVLCFSSAMALNGGSDVS